MLRRIAIVTLWSTLVAVSASAQRTEASVSIGYAANDGIATGPRFLLGQTYDTAGLDDGKSYNATIGVFASRGVEFEFLFARQDADLAAGGPAGGLQITRTAVYNYMGNVVYNWGDEDSVLTASAEACRSATAVRWVCSRSAVPPAGPCWATTAS